MSGRMGTKNEQKTGSVFSLENRQNTESLRTDTLRNIPFASLNEEQQNLITKLSELKEKGFVGEIRITESGGNITIHAQNSLTTKSSHIATSQALNTLDLGANKEFNELKEAGIITNNLPTSGEYFVLNGENFESKTQGYGKRVENYFRNALGKELSGLIFREGR